MNLRKQIAAIAAVGCAQGCTFAKTVIYNVAGLDDHRIFARATQPSPLRALSRVPRFVAEMQVSDETGALPATSTRTATTANTST